MMYAVLIELYGNEHEPRKFRLSPPYFTKQEAQDYVDLARRENLPYKNKWVVNFENPVGAAQ